MGQVAVLHPHDCLSPHHRRRRRRHPSSPLKTPPKVIPPHQPLRRKKTLPPPPPSSNNLVMGQVKILRRGDLLPGSTPLPGQGLLPLPPHQEVVQIRVPSAEFSRPEAAQQVNGFYAGSAALVASPPPSSVPLPGFFAKRGGGLTACDSATSDLRRILRLD